jgi:hypothetical protein
VRRHSIFRVEPAAASRPALAANRVASPGRAAVPVVRKAVVSGAQPARPPGRASQQLPAPMNGIHFEFGRTRSCVPVAGEPTDAQRSGQPARPRQPGCAGATRADGQNIRPHRLTRPMHSDGI